MVLKVLADKTQWFGSGSRIIVVTNDKHFLRAHGIAHIYEVSLPSRERALEMLCQSAFMKTSPPEGFEELVVEVARHAGRLPLGLNVLGSYFRGRDKEYWMEMLTRLQNGLDSNIEKILRISYDGIGSKEDQAIFRHIACLFNLMKVKTIKLLLADSNLGVNIALQNLYDKSLIHVGQHYVEMHSLLEKMGRNIVRTQSVDKPGKREFLVDSEDIFYVLNEGTGTQKVLGISFDTSEIDELYVHENAFKGMRNLRFLKIYSKIYTLEEEDRLRLHLPEGFDCLPLKLKLLVWERYPVRRLPSNFCPVNLVKPKMKESKLDKLWKGVVSLSCLKKLDLAGSCNLKEIPDLSKATNLEKLDLEGCSSVVELPSSIRNLNKLMKLNMGFCESLETLPTGFNLKSLDHLCFMDCSQLRTFPEFSTNISVLDLFGTHIEEFPSNIHLKNLVQLDISKDDCDEKQYREGAEPLRPSMWMLTPTLTKLRLYDFPSLVELSSLFHNLNQLKDLKIVNCINLETLPTGLFFKYLSDLNLFGCSRLRSFPSISTNISELDLSETGIEEVPWWIENFTKLNNLTMENCSKLIRLSLHIFKLKHLTSVKFSECGALTRVDLSGYSSEPATEADNIDTVPEEASSSSFPDSCVPKVDLDFMYCFKLDPEILFQQKSIIFNSMVFSGEQVPSYFTHRTTGMSSLTNIPLLLSQPFFRFRVCAAVIYTHDVDIDVNCQFKGKFRNRFDSTVKPRNSIVTWEGNHQLLIYNCRIPLNKDNAPLGQLNYDHLDMKIHLSAGPLFSIRGWGIRILDSEECEDSDDSYIGSETDQSEESGDSGDSDSGIGSETDQSEECGDSEKQ